MSFILKNKSLVDIDLNELGVTIQAQSTIEIASLNESCVNLDASILVGDVVFTTMAGVEKTQAESQLIAAGAVTPLYESRYNRTEIDQKFADLLGATSTTLDTLNELAAALANDPNFATTIAAQIDAKAPLSHDHDLLYTPLIHDHSLLYYDRAAIDLLAGTKSDIAHVHPYADMAHSHTEYALQADLEAYSMPVFGSEYHYAQSVGVTTISQRYPYVVLEMPVTVTHAGKYKLASAYMWSHDHTSTDFRCDIVHTDPGGNSASIYSHVQEPKDSSGSFANTGTDQKIPASWSGLLDLTAGVHMISVILNIDQTNNGGRKKSSIWDLTTELWRVL